MNKQTSIIIVLSILSIKPMFSFYEQVRVMPYHWDKNGTLLILLAKEKSKTTQQWSNLFGKKEKKDKNALKTALKMVAKETAGQLKIHRSKDKPFFYQDGSTIHFILSTHFINPKKIGTTRNNTSNKVKLYIPKKEWKWVSAEDLLREKANLPLCRTLKRTLQERKVRTYLRELIAEKPILLLKRSHHSKNKHHKKR